MFHPPSTSGINNPENLLPYRNGFLTKLIDILSDEKNQGVIRWSERGDSFVILNKALLCNEVLPKYFKTNRIESLIRQLHSYGFRKISTTKTDLEKMEFTNNHFRRNRPELLAHILKNAHTKPTQKSQNVEPRTDPAPGQIDTFKNLYENLLLLAQKAAALQQAQQNRTQPISTQAPTLTKVSNFSLDNLLAKKTESSQIIESKIEEMSPSTSVIVKNTVVSSMAVKNESSPDKIIKIESPESLSKNQRFEKVPSFIKKLWFILEDAETQNIICWDGTKSNINIIDPVTLAKIVLPKFFLHNNFSTFVRQLNMYGFRKISAIKNAQVGQVYNHPCFVHEKPELLFKVNRHGPEMSKNPRKNQEKSNQQESPPKSSFFHIDALLDKTQPPTQESTSSQQKAALADAQPRMSFPKKLYDIIENQEFEKIIKWNENGEAFHIFDQVMFCQRVLPQYFKHNNFNSFIRQLNFYQFHKLPVLKRTNNDEQVYSHPFFKRGHPQLLNEIKRPPTGPPTMAKIPTILDRKRPFNETTVVDDETEGAYSGLKIEEIE